MSNTTRSTKHSSKVVEDALLDRLRGHSCATVDELFDTLPSDEVRCLIAGLGRKAIRIQQAITKKKAGG